MQSFKRAKSTLSDLPRQIGKDRDGSNMHGKTVELSDLRPGSLVPCSVHSWVATSIERSRSGTHAGATDG